MARSVTQYRAADRCARNQGDVIVRDNAAVIYLAIAVIVVVALMWLALRSGERAVVRVWRAGIVVGGVGVVAVFASLPTGNFGLLFIGGPPAFLGLCLAVGLAVPVYRDRERTLGPSLEHVAPSRKPPR